MTKRVLKLFPREFLIKLSLFLQPILSILFIGSKFTDPINGKQYSHFLSYGYNNLRPNALCPGLYHWKDTDCCGFILIQSLILKINF